MGQMNNEGPLARPFVVLSGGNDEFAVLDGDAHLLAGEESGVFDPKPGELNSGLYYFKARFYDPAIGRFLQTDPVGTKDDLNLYAYVGNNPVNRVDPTGLAKVVAGDAIQVAGMPYQGAAGSWASAMPDKMPQLRMYGPTGTPWLTSIWKPITETPTRTRTIGMVRAGTMAPPFQSYLGNGNGKLNADEME